MARLSLAPRRLLPALVLAASVLAVQVPPAAAAGFSVRLEAGPHRAVTFGSGWTVTSSRTVTLSSPTLVTASSRRTEPPGGTWLRITSGALAGSWVRESRLAYLPGFAGSAAFSPARAITLPVGTYELYRFDAAGVMTAARARVVTAPAGVSLDRSAVVRGQRHVRIADGTWAGWWIPGSSASPVRIGCTAGDPPAGTAGVVVRSVPAATGRIALTFDMGGRLEPALRILRYLELERVCATIFPTGAMARTDVGRAVMAEIRAHPELFELGNHTVNHCNLRDGGGGSACPSTRPSDAFATRELQDADAILWELAGRHTTPYWRPPYGAVDSRLVKVAAAAGYPYTMMWSTDTIDWKRVRDGGPTAAQMAAKVVAGRTAGGIVLMHLGGYQTRNALPAMLAGLRAAGYTATSISELYR